MFVRDTNPLVSAFDSEAAGNSYFGNPYHTEYEQYGLEHLDRNSDSEDDIAQVVILGYN